MMVIIIIIIVIIVTVIIVIILDIVIVIVNVAVMDITYLFPICFFFGRTFTTSIGRTVLGSSFKSLEN